MADISLKLTAEKLGKSLENISVSVEEELNQAVKNLAEGAYSAMISQIQSMSLNPKNRQDYLRGLKFRDLGNDSYLIYLDGDWANKLEDGFSAYDMKETLLSSEKTVKVGKRAGEKWVRRSKKGKKYAAVPFEHKPHSKDKGGSGDLQSEIKSLMAKGINGQVQSILETFKTPDGKPLSGKVASVSAADVKNPNLANLTKYQYVGKSGKVSSVYMTYRMIHEDSSGWMHKGFSGYNIFSEAEKWVEKELEHIVKTLLK